ncbi:Sterol 3-beta-glucosyltransferase [Madurella mycetomatis]|uniref:Sterol 3-beta-glucosyltransferase n=1 Tax=Madurella mycetomatis TaxID=100816 RepID=A0A175VSP8_9PEZI|nr:Sterol 3-beta-glucosyltransferase [Madurella mycetomatis]
MSAHQTSAGPDYDPVRVESLALPQNNGHHVSLVRDAAGNIAYPSFVPPETQSPTSASTQDRQPSSPPANAGQPQLTAQSASVGSPTRPLGRQWATELPQGHASKNTTPPTMRRADTSASVAMRAAGDGYTSSSDSSSSDEEDGHAHKPRKKTDKDKDDPYRRFRLSHPHYHTKGHVSKRDGRLTISLRDTSNTGYLAKALGTAARKMVPRTPSPSHGTGKAEPLSHPPTTAEPTEPPHHPYPRLNIVIMVIGSRGDAQPFLKIGKLLRDRYHHRVRIATHPAFREFVEQDSPGLEFFSVGGDPSELMSFMVKNPGMIPTLSSVKAGDISRRRAAMAEMFQGFWRACINATDDERDTRNVKMMGRKDPFVADAIIANPPSFAHIHCAEALGIPVHLMFTFPYTPTQAFPHPLASIKKSNVDPGYTNFISYPLVEMMVWQGLGDLVNDFRVKTLGLDPVSTLWAPGATYRLHVPFTYLWSPGLVPKPSDWGGEVDVAGFVFLDLASSFDPPDPLNKFLEGGDEPPIYIGFGSIVVDDADRFTQMIFDAVKLAGVRALVSKGWGGLGGDSLDVPDNVFLLDNTPHDWLFPKVRACVIHGGAGTTAIALKCGKPTMIVPFFGDQHFWGTMVANTGAGPQPVPYKHLTAEKLAEGIRYCITGEAREAAERIARDIEKEGDGAENACRAFHRGLLLKGSRSMRCSIFPDKVAVWQMKKTGLRLSVLAAELLVERGLVSWKKLRLLRHNEWNDFEGPGEPVTGVAGSLMTSVGDVFKGIGGVPYRIVKGSKKRREKRRKRKEGDGTGQGVTEKQKPGDSRPGDPAQPSVNGQNSVPHVETSTTNAIRRRGTASTTATNPAEDVVRQVGRGAYKSAAALVRIPVDFSLALAQGFHNAPRLYGDNTVRRPTRVTGIRSGLRAAGHEFVYGIYDGWTGVVRLPIRGARDGGVRGFMSGVGMGLTGFVLKDIAAIIGPVGYTLKGVVKQAERGRQPVKYIRKARLVQGEREVSALAELERNERVHEVISGWKLMRQLWEEMRREERKKHKNLRARLGSGKRRLRRSQEWNTAFESVEVAQKVLDALRRGDGLESALGKDMGEAGKLSRPSVGETTSAGGNDKQATEPGSASDVPVDESLANPESDTGEMEENPFSTATPAITENKAENRQTKAALDGQALA